MAAELPKDWKDCTALMAQGTLAGAVRTSNPDDPWPWIAWVDEDGISALDDEDNEVEPPDAVRLWLEEQAKEPTP